MKVALRVALYARVSSESQADRGTIEGQADFLRRYTELHGLEVAGEYFDEAITGPTPLRERPAGMRLVADAHAKKFAKVLFYRVDRFARSLHELLDAQKLLDSLGIGLQSATEPFDTTTPMGRFMFQLLGGIAELEKSVIMERTTSGRARAARDGKWTGGPPPFAYAIVEGRLAPREPEASIVRTLFEAIAGGGTMRQEAQRMNEAGLLGRAGKPWTEGRLSKLVHCPTYKGNHVFRGRDGVLSRDVPAIVSPEIWEAAHVQLKRNSVQRPEYRFNLLRGKIRCANCGGQFVASKKSGGHKVYYRCLRSIRSGPKHCLSANLNAGALEAYVWALCLDLLQRPEQISGFAEEEVSRLRRADEGRAKELQRLQQALADEEAAKQRIIHFVHLGKITDEDAAAELDAVNEAVGKLHHQLSTLDSSRSLANAYVHRLREAETFVTKLAKSVDLNTQEGQRQVIDALLQGVDAQTNGEGRERRVYLTFRLLAQEPWSTTDTQEYNDTPVDELYKRDELIEKGVKVFRLAAVLSQQAAAITEFAMVATTSEAC